MKRVSKNLALWIVVVAIFLFVIFYFKSTKESFYAGKLKQPQIASTNTNKKENCIKNGGTWYLRGSDRICSCPDRMVNSDSTDDASSCVECGIYAIKDGNECKKCSFGQYVVGNSCKKCLNITANSCVKCPSGQYLDNDSCKTCPANTTVSAAGTSCDTCYTYIKDGVCFSCPPNQQYFQGKCVLAIPGLRRH
jgi:hypothetical protein